MGSMRARLAAATACVAAIVLAVLALLVVMQVRDVAVIATTQQAGDDLRPYAVDLVHDPEEEPDPAASGVLVLVEGPDGRVRRDSMPRALAAAARGVTSAETVVVDAGRYRVVARTVSAPTGRWRLWAARDLTASDALLRGVLVTVALGAPVAVLVVALVAWLAATGALRPVERLRSAADRLRTPGAGGDLPTAGGTELASLAATLNTLIGDLRRSVARERRVTADAAHELRTPLAVLAAQVELAERSPDRADLPAIRASVDRMVRLTDDLLALARVDAAAGPTGSATVGELLTEAMEAVDRARLLAPEGVLVDLDIADRLDESAVVALDVTGFGRVLANLVGNAFTAGPARTVLVRLSREDGAFVLHVVDDGPGLPEAFLPFAFDRFARAEGEQSRAAEGSGLGLALVKRVVERAGGTAELRNGDAGGAVATVRLPVARGRAE